MVSKLSSKLQLTLALIKPDVMANPLILEEIEQRLLSEGFIFVRRCQTRLSRQRAEHFYSVHKERFFYNRLVTFMSSGLITAIVLCRENAISHWRAVMGNTKVYRTIHEEPDTIRGMFALTDTRNCVHGSDSESSATREISAFFPDFSFNEFYKNMEANYRLSHVTFDTLSRTHKTD